MGEEGLFKYTSMGRAEMYLKEQEAIWEQLREVDYKSPVKAIHFAVMDNDLPVKLSDYKHVLRALDQAKTCGACVPDEHKVYFNLAGKSLQELQELLNLTTAYKAAPALSDAPDIHSQSDIKTQLASSCGVQDVELIRRVLLEETDAKRVTFKMKDAPDTEIEAYIVQRPILLTKQDCEQLKDILQQGRQLLEDEKHDIAHEKALFEDGKGKYKDERKPWLLRPVFSDGDDRITWFEDNIRHIDEQSIPLIDAGLREITHGYSEGNHSDRWSGAAERTDAFTAKSSAMESDPLYAAKALFVRHKIEEIRQWRDGNHSMEYNGETYIVSTDGYLMKNNTFLKEGGKKVRVNTPPEQELIKNSLEHRFLQLTELYAIKQRYEKGESRLSPKDYLNTNSRNAAVTNSLASSFYLSSDNIDETIELYNKMYINGLQNLPPKNHIQFTATIHNCSKEEAVAILDNMKQPNGAFKPFKVEDFQAPSIDEANGISIRYTSITDKENTFTDDEKTRVAQEYLLGALGGTHSEIDWHKLQHLDLRSGSIDLNILDIGKASFSGTVGGADYKNEPAYYMDFRYNGKGSSAVAGHDKWFTKRLVWKEDRQNGAMIPLACYDPNADTGPAALEWVGRSGKPHPILDPSRGIPHAMINDSLSEGWKIGQRDNIKYQADFLMPVIFAEHLGERFKETPKRINNKQQDKNNNTSPEPSTNQHTALPADKNKTKNTLSSNIQSAIKGLKGMEITHTSTPDAPDTFDSGLVVHTSGAENKVDKPYDRNNSTNIA